MFKGKEDLNSMQNSDFFLGIQNMKYKQTGAGMEVKLLFDCSIFFYIYFGSHFFLWTLAFCCLLFAMVCKGKDHDPYFRICTFPD